MTTIILEGNALHSLYDSLEEFEVAYKKQLDNNPHARNHADVNIFKKPYTKGDKWFGVENAAIAMQKVRDGWPEMHARLTAMWGDERPELQLAASTVKVRRRKRQRADYGDTLDIHRVWNGELDRAWERPEREYRLSVSQRHATIYIDLATSCAQSADSVLWRSAAALLICDILQSTGRAVEIYVGSTSSETYHPGPGCAFTGIRVKEYTQPIQVERLTAMTTMAFFRTYGFLLLTAVPYNIRYHTGMPLHRGMPKQLVDREKAGELVVAIRECYSMKDAEREFFKVRDMLAKEAA
jgi:hypothetical protein